MPGCAFCIVSHLIHIITYRENEAIIAPIYRREKWLLDTSKFPKKGKKWNSDIILSNTSVPLASLTQNKIPGIFIKEIKSEKI